METVAVGAAEWWLMTVDDAMVEVERGGGCRRPRSALIGWPFGDYMPVLDDDVDLLSVTKARRHSTTYGLRLDF